MSMWHHSKKWHSKLPGRSSSVNPIVFRGEIMNSIKHEPIEPKYIEKAGRMLQDENYQKKVNEVMAMMQGKRTANSKYIGSPVHRD